ncbi:hypothetical protein [Chryseobacterium sp.]|uniref:hypothetical protein n=1 Tax=Chryseobacterium sp. TaxID=1871047 RepID=UPI0026297558|nr:hypothetical protein [Chryseobacterium sp.]
MHEDSFQILKIFEEKEINKFCDLVTQDVLGIANVKPYLVGSVAKMLNGELSETYVPKDVDFAIDNISYRKIIHNDKLFKFAIMVERRPERLIIYCPGVIIELWNFLQRNLSEKIEIKNNKIPYLCQ